MYERSGTDIEERQNKQYWEHGRPQVVHKRVTSNTLLHQLSPRGQHIYASEDFIVVLRAWT